MNEVTAIIYILARAVFSNQSGPGQLTWLYTFNRDCRLEKYMPESNKYNDKIIFFIIDIGDIVMKITFKKYMSGFHALRHIFHYGFSRACSQKENLVTFLFFT